MTNDETGNEDEAYFVIDSLRSPFRLPAVVYFAALSSSFWFRHSARAQGHVQDQRYFEREVPHPPPMAL